MVCRRAPAPDEIVKTLSRHAERVVDGPDATPDNDGALQWLGKSHQVFHYVLGFL